MQIELHIPSRNEIETLKVGDMAPNAWGRRAEVVEVTCRKQDIKGRLFVCYYTKDAPDSTSRTSNSMKEGELLRTVGASFVFNSNELRAVEADMLSKGETSRFVERSK